MNYIKKISFLLFFLSTQLLVAQSSNERLEQAYQAQTALKYDEAIQQYKSLMDEGFYSADLCFNTAMAYYGKEDLGHTILYLEKASRLAPYDHAVSKNLELIRNEQEDALLSLPTFFLKAWWDTFTARLSPNSWGIMAILSSILAALFLLLWVLKKMNGWRKFQLLGMSIALVLAVVFLFSGNSRATILTTEKEAVILDYALDLHIAPGEDTDIDSTIHAGLKVEILDQFEDWMKIRLVDGREGWVKLNGVGII